MLQYGTTGPVFVMVFVSGREALWGLWRARGLRHDTAMWDRDSLLARLSCLIALYVCWLAVL